MLESLHKTKETVNNNTHKMYVSVPVNRVNDIIDSLRKIFEEEQKSRDSILLSYKPSAIYKLADYISGKISRSASIGIAGETASGKSTITLDIIDTINSFATEFELNNIITRVNTDDYYYDRSDMVKAAGSFAEFAKHYDLDVPAALELELMSKHIKELLSGKSVYLPKYDMSGTAKRYDDYTLAKPSKIVISEGLFTLTEKIKDAFDFKIYVDVRHHIQKERFYIRAAERDLGDSADTIYQNASQKAEVYIRPCKKDADIVLSGESDRARYKEFLNKIISLVQKYNFKNREII
jgi:uridine kinase